ncbi:SDR family oxidoreductase [Salipaludibacillus agaradhaerens]|jgi:NAD(P)-dependent dehydrogenase (short-subunit alcohol dehydrogenase family)|uniref:SDR family oxidoreductase n=1 Tax=Salipaludibacillus agaradhaerens TaxID=76935 RepID=UPI000996E28D|nr:SDR family oxidoreductase [Salipaludibacillus agaradhaerens]UJW56140.1 SDR family oxidoreductase [Bacillus sp. A116_S68]
MTVPFKVDVKDKVVVITGGSGILGSVMSKALAELGAKVAILALDENANEKVVSEINRAGGHAAGFIVDVLNREALEKARAEITKTFGTCDILINGAGGNHPKATTTDEKLKVENITNELEQTFFDLDPSSVEWLFKLNFIGTLLPTQVFAQDMAGKTNASIINISSMNAFRPLTKIPAYSGAKAAISNFTQWLSTYFAEVGIRVNAIAPGFFLTAQNEALLKNEDGSYTERAEKILSQTPQGRFGEPEELLGTLLWLVDQSSSFVNGIVVPIDGGFSAYSGV